ncbi:MAG: hypothetical protein CGW95_11740 [Phenylobacterium zucineum]|nr:MAG: hypothetical protein CGW95_11740 [Phenylobacterium zucineum]
MGHGSRIDSQQLLATLARELEYAGAMCERVESLVTQLVRANRGEEVEVNLFEIQALDMLIQHLAALADFTQRLSNQETDGGLDVETAAAEVKLADLAGRLGAPIHLKAPLPSVATSGDLDLF